MVILLGDDSYMFDFNALFIVSAHIFPPLPGLKVGFLPLIKSIGNYGIMLSFFPPLLLPNAFSWPWFGSWFPIQYHDQADLSA